MWGWTGRSGSTSASPSTPPSASPSGPASPASSTSPPATDSADSWVHLPALHPPPYPSPQTLPTSGEGFDRDDSVNQGGSPAVSSSLYALFRFTRFVECRYSTSCSRKCRIISRVASPNVAIDSRLPNIGPIVRIAGDEFFPAQIFPHPRTPLHLLRSAPFSPLLLPPRSMSFVTAGMTRTEQIPFSPTTNSQRYPPCPTSPEPPPAPSHSRFSSSYLTQERNGSPRLDGEEEEGEVHR